MSNAKILEQLRELIDAAPTLEDAVRDGCIELSDSDLADYAIVKAASVQCYSGELTITIDAIGLDLSNASIDFDVTEHSECALIDGYEFLGLLEQIKEGSDEGEALARACDTIHEQMNELHASISRMHAGMIDTLNSLGEAPQAVLTEIEALRAQCSALICERDGLLAQAPVPIDFAVGILQTQLDEQRARADDAIAERETARTRCDELLAENFRLNSQMTALRKAFTDAGVAPVEFARPE